MEGQQLRGGRAGHTEQQILLTSLKGSSYVLSAAAAARLADSGGCSICTSELGAGEEVLEVDCGHVFHHACLAAWLQKQPTCPLCRSQVLDIGAVLDDLVRQVHVIRDRRLHHHELLHPLELLTRLAKDPCHSELCAKRFGIKLLMEIGLPIGCPMIRIHVLEVLLIWSAKSQMQEVLEGAREEIALLLFDCLEQERPNIRAAACAIVWNLAAIAASSSSSAAQSAGGEGEPQPSQLQQQESPGSSSSGGSSSSSCHDLSGFLPIVAELVKDQDPLVATRARRALWFLIQDRRHSKTFIQSTLWPPLLDVIEKSALNTPDWNFCLHTMVVSVEMQIGTASRSPQSFPPQFFLELFRLLRSWLERDPPNNPLVHRAALLLSRIACRDPRPEYMERWLDLLDEDRPLWCCLQATAPEPESPRNVWAGSSPEDLATSFEDWRTCALGVTWNLAIHPSWRLQLCQRVMGGLSAIAQCQELQRTTRERLLTALWHLSQDAPSIADKRWAGMAEALCEHVAQVSPEVQLTGLELLENIVAVHSEAVVPSLLKLLWRLASEPDGRTQGIALRLLLGYTVNPPSSDWLQLPEDYGLLFGNLVRHFQERRSEENAAEAHHNHHGKASLIGMIWNLSMDSKHHETLGRAFMHHVPALLQDPCRTVVERTITAAFCLVSHPANAARLREGFGTCVPVLIDLIRGLADKDKKYQLLNVMLNVETVCKVQEQKEVMDPASGKTLSSETLRFLSEPDVFDSAIDENGNLKQKHYAECRLAIAGLNFVMHISPCRQRREQLLTKFPGLQPEGALMRLISANAVSKMDADARSSGIGIVWNLAMAASPDEAQVIADRTLWRVLKIASLRAESEKLVDVATCQRLVTTLFYLARDKAVCSRPIWEEHVEGVCAVIQAAIEAVDRPSPPSLSSACGLLLAMVTHHPSVQWLPRVMPLLVKRAADTRIPSGAVFIHVTSTSEGRDWLLTNTGTPFLALIWRCIKSHIDCRPMTELASRGKMEWLMVLWNMFADPAWSNRFEPEHARLLLPFIAEPGETTARQCAHMAAMFSRRDAHLRHLCAHPSVWMLLERTAAGNRLDDVGLADFLELVHNVLALELGSEGGDDAGEASCKRVVTMLSSSAWTTKLQCSREWPRAFTAELRLLAMVAENLPSGPALLWASPLLHAGGSVDRSLRLAASQLGSHSHTGGSGAEVLQVECSLRAAALVSKLQRQLRLSVEDVRSRFGAAAALQSEKQPPANS